MSVSPTKDQLMAVGPRRNSVVGALSPVDDQLHVGYVVKCGGSVRSWKRRWMVLGADGERGVQKFSSSSATELGLNSRCHLLLSEARS